MIDTKPPSTLAEQLAAAQEWWRDAGVDVAFSNEPRNWLEQPAAAPAVEPALSAPAAAAVKSDPQAPPLGGDKARWPVGLKEFADWWVSEESLETGGTGPRIAARGPAGAELMVLVPMPEESDEERLLSGPQGRLLANILDAMGIGAREPPTWPRPCPGTRNIPTGGKSHDASSVR